MKEEQDNKNKIKDMAITLLFVLLAIYCVIGSVRQRQTGQLFYIFGYRPVVILSGSMEPTIKTGTVVIVKKTEEIEEQDIICFLTDDRSLVVHRYVDTDESGRLITKGDHNPTEDLDHIRPGQVEGKIVLKMDFTAPIISKTL